VSASLRRIANSTVFTAVVIAAIVLASINVGLLS